MIIGLLIMIIGIIPIALAIGTRIIFGNSDLLKPILLYMFLITVWQMDIGVLYLEGVLPKEWILILYRLFKMAPIYSITVVFYVAYTIKNNYSVSYQENSLLEKLSRFFSKKVLIGLLIWSTSLYIINWTKLGTEGLTLLKVSNNNYYYPEHGDLHWLYVPHLISYIFITTILFLVSKIIQNQYMMKFIRNFSLYSFLIISTGLVNFIPSTGAVASSLGVVIFSILIIFSFVKLNVRITMKYNRLTGQQKKMDYTGNLAASLVHEVQNNVQIIKGFSQLISESPSLNNNEKAMIDLICKASIQLEDLSHNYKKFIESSKIEYKMEDINEIIREAIEFANEITKKTNLSILFEQKFTTLKAYVNKPNLQQVFINLIKNSAEAIPEYSSNRLVSIETDIVKGMILIHFKDTGKGIPENQRSSVFDPFSSSKYTGMGMGLPFAKKIILEHRGDISIVSSSPNGTHFQIELPQYELQV